MNTSYSKYQLSSEYIIHQKDILFSLSETISSAFQGDGPSCQHLEGAGYTGGTLFLGAVKPAFFSGSQMLPFPLPFQMLLSHQVLRDHFHLSSVYQLIVFDLNTGEVVKTHFI